MDIIHIMEYSVLEYVENQYHSKTKEREMSTYKICVQITIMPCDEVPTQTPGQERNGSLSIVLSEDDAIKIDTCEQALLQTTYPMRRDALASHVSPVSKRKACEHSVGERW